MAKTILQQANSGILNLINGTSRNDTITGTANADRIFSGSGDDLVYAGDGDDIVYGGSGKDRLYGGNGNDMLNGEAGNDTLVGGAGNDILYGGDGNDILVSDNIDGTVSAMDTTPQAEGMYGGNGNDTLFFNSNNIGGTYAFGDNGDDTFYINRGNANIWGGAGSDKFRISALDAVNGAPAVVNIDLSDLSSTSNIWQSDYLKFYASASTSMTKINVSNYIVGSDWFSATAPSDFIANSVFTYKADGTTTINYSNVEMIVDAVVSKSDYISSSGLSKFYPIVSAPMVGSIDADNINGTAGKDYVYGGDGDDLINGAEGDDYLNGEAGNDTIKGGDGNDRLLGGDGNDFIDAGAGADIIYGGAGNDMVNLGADKDKDIFFGEDGNDFTTAYESDEVYMGSGNDMIKFDWDASDNTKTKIDTGSGDDKIYLNNIEGDGEVYITSGDGLDKFEFRNFYNYDQIDNGGKIIITDYDTNADTFKFSGVTNGSLVFDYVDGNTLVTSSELGVTLEFHHAIVTADNFIF